MLFMMDRDRYLYINYLYKRKSESYTQLRTLRRVVVIHYFITSIILGAIMVGYQAEVWELGALGL
jgi:hypothetical protein